MEDLNFNNENHINEDNTPTPAQDDANEAIRKCEEQTDNNQGTEDMSRPYAYHPQTGAGQTFGKGYPYSTQHNGYNNGGYSNPYSTYNQTAKNPYVGVGSVSYTFANDPSYGAESKISEPKQKKKKGSVLKVIAIVLCCVILSGAVGLGSAYFTYNYLSKDDGAQTVPQNNNTTDNSQNTDVPTITDEDRAPINVNKNEGSTTQPTPLTEVISSVRDTVVEIVTENITESQFYGQYVTSGAGSGVIINENGYIITNNHVVDGANKIFVRTTDNKEYNAVLMGKDSESDIAVIKIDATGLSAATLGDSSAIKLGEQVIAIGNPLGSLGGTVTDGIISALDREVTIDGQKMVLLQTNAAVNPGNSGGGLFNMSGELIGIVNAKSSSSSSGATIEGLGFAIPINHAYEVAAQLIEHGYVRGKVSLTITVYAYEKDMTYKQGFTYYTIKAGVYVEDAGKNTELQKNDRFVSIDGISILKMSDIKEVLANHKVGDKIKAKVIRTENNQETEIEITLTCFEQVPSDLN